MTVPISRAGYTALAIQAPGVKAAKEVLQPGEKATLPVTGVQAGTYTVYCPVDGHAGLGMTTTLTVAK